jgi:hypothetical protein
MVHHLLTEHSSIISERQVSAHADMCERGVNETESSSCLVCREGMSTARLHHHLATHMEELALFVLPLIPDDSGDEYIQELIEDNSQPDSSTGEIDAAAAADTVEVATREDAVKEPTITATTVEAEREKVTDEHKKRMTEAKAVVDATEAESKAAKAENEKMIAEAKVEHEKKMAEAKNAAAAAEAAREVAEEELKKNAPGPDADKPPLIFIDAMGRSFTLPWHLVKTWVGMKTLIRQAFVNIERIGPHVVNGRYHLIGPHGQIILPQVWDTVVQPGWEIQMQMWPLPSDPPEVKVNRGIRMRPSKWEGEGTMDKIDSEDEHIQKFNEDNSQPDSSMREIPSAPVALPQPTAEEIQKRREDEAKIQAEALVKALRVIQLEEKAAVAAIADKDQKVQAESDKIALLLAGFEKERLAREEAAAAKAAMETARPIDMPEKVLGTGNNPDRTLLSADSCGDVPDTRTQTQPATFECKTCPDHHPFAGADELHRHNKDYHNIS